MTRMIKPMTVVDRKPWATLWHGVRGSYDYRFPPRDIWAVQTIDDPEKNNDMHYNTRERCYQLFNRQINLAEFYGFDRDHDWNAPSKQLCSVE